MYTGLADGRIVRAKGEELETVTTINGHICQQKWHMSKCGRPLAMRFDKGGSLFTLDAYSGVKRINVTTGEVVSIFDTRSGPIAGHQVIFIDDFVIDEGAGTQGGHVLYITESSAKWPVEYVNLVVFEHESSGRILRLDTDSKQVTVIGDKLAFANGIELNDDKSAILYNELNKRRIMKHYIRGPKSGHTLVLADNLHGEPDNIRRSAQSQETYWVALYSGKDLHHQDPLLDGLSSLPTVKKALVRLGYHLGHALSYLGERLQYVPLQQKGFDLRTASFYQHLTKSYGLAIEVDSDGKVLRSLHSPNGQTTFLSQVTEVIEHGQRVLYLGSYFNDYIGRLVIS